MSADELLSKLVSVQGKGPRWRAICPAHESKHRTRSLAIYEPDRGRILIHCHAGCSVHEITGAIGIALSDLFPPRCSDDKRKTCESKPWLASDIIRALRGEIAVAWVLLADVAHGRPHSEDDCQRAAIALERVTHFMQELERAG